MAAGKFKYNQQKTTRGTPIATSSGTPKFSSSVSSSGINVTDSASSRANTMLQNQKANEDLTKYSNDYQAEINKRSAANPSDPTISKLNDLRNAKIASGGAQTYTNYSPLYDKYNTPTTGMYYTPTQTQGYADSYLQSMYDKLGQYQDNQNTQMLNSLRAAYDENRNNLDSQRSTIQQNANDLRNQNDTEYYTKSLPQLYSAMEAAGQRGGENVTGRVALETARGQNLNNINTYEGNQLNNLALALSNLDSQQAQAVAQAQQGINSDVLTQQLSALKEAMNQYNTQQSTAQSNYQQSQNNFDNTIGAYSGDYQAEINRVQSLINQGQVYDTDGVSLSYKKNALNAARNQKLASLQAAAQEAAQQQFENSLAQQKTDYTTGKPYYNPNSGSKSSGGSLTYEQAVLLYNQGDRSNAVLKVLGLS